MKSRPDRVRWQAVTVRDLRGGQAFVVAKENGFSQRRIQSQDAFQHDALQLLLLDDFDCSRQELGTCNLSLPGSASALAASPLHCTVTDRAGKPLPEQRAMPRARLQGCDVGFLD